MVWSSVECRDRGACCQRHVGSIDRPREALGRAQVGPQLLHATQLDGAAHAVARVRTAACAEHWAAAADARTIENSLSAVLGP